MTTYEFRRRVFASVLFVAALVLLWTVSWRVALGTFLFVWGNNLESSLRVLRLLRLRP